jgi:Rhs element Vgr protein
MSVVTPTISSAGQVMDPSYQLVSIDVIKEVNRISRAQLVLLDGHIAKQRFEISDTAFFEPGKEIEIKLRYEGEPDTEATVFKGLVIKHSVEADAQGSLLTVDLKDAMVKLTLTRKSAIYRDQSDAEIIHSIIENNGLIVDTIDAGEPRHPEFVQYYCNDWDFILARAEAQGLLVTVDDGIFAAKKPVLDGEASYRFEYGLSEIYNLEIEADAEYQRAGMQSVAWDIANQSLTPPTRANDFKTGQGNLQASPLAQAFGADNETLTDAVPLDQAELQAWADARLTRSRMALLRGRLTVSGIATLKPLDVVEIAGISERFNGKTLVTGVRHRVGTEQGWLTDIQFGLSADSYCRRPDIADMPAAGLVPAVQGLRIGVVAEFEDDSAGLFRVKTVLPGVGAEGDAVWARLATPEAGKQRGYFFPPETGDEVVLGFFNDDPRQAVILGALYSPVNTPYGDWSKLTEKNIKKGIVTKSGAKIEFTDQEKSKLLIETHAANKILLDDDAQSIQIADQHGNAIVMNSAGIEIKCDGDLKIDAGGNVEIKGSKVDVK